MDLLSLNNCRITLDQVYPRPLPAEKRCATLKSWEWPGDEASIECAAI